MKLPKIYMGRLSQGRWCGWCVCLNGAQRMTNGSFWEVLRYLLWAR